MKTNKKNQTRDANKSKYAALMMDDKHSYSGPAVSDGEKQKLAAK